MLSEDEARKRVQKISDEADDAEAAHWLEDKLREDVLRMIASDGFDNIVHARELAKIALSTEELDFPRWYA